MHVLLSVVEQLPSRLMFSFDPSPQEQEMIELINRMRTQPAEELGKLVNLQNPQTSVDPDVTNALSFFNVSATSLIAQWSQLQPVQPLAWSEALATSALTHSQLMIQNDTQSHNLPGEPSLVDRFRNAGYGQISSAGGSFSPAESVYAYGTSVFQTHAAFAIDWGPSPLDTTGDGIQDPPGHRNAMMRAGFREVGVSYTEENDDDTQVGPAVTTVHFGAWSDYARPELDDPYLLGVAYDDGNGNGTYDAGEGLGGVNVRITGPGGTSVTTSMSAGGWQQRVTTPGTYVVTFEGGNLTAPVSYTRTVGAQNVKLDLNTGVAPTSVAFLGADGWVYTRGTEQPDVISFEKSDTEIVVTTNGVVDRFPIANVIGLSANTYPGDDLVTISRDIFLTTQIGTGQGDDTIIGGSGNDYIIARLGNDIVYGGPGNDTIMTGRGDDLIGGGAGDDSIFAGQGVDTINGGSGDDIIDSRDSTFADIVIGGSGIDSAKVDALIDGSDFEVLIA